MLLPDQGYLPLLGVGAAIALGSQALNITGNSVTAEELGSQKGAIRICGILAIVCGLAALVAFVLRFMGLLRL